jgi:hypothetical protein
LTAALALFARDGPPKHSSRWKDSMDWRGGLQSIATP